MKQKRRSLGSQPMSYPLNPKPLGHSPCTIIQLIFSFIKAMSLFSSGTHVYIGIFYEKGPYREDIQVDAQVM